MDHSLPLVVLAGRPNVGKSTLFNRITRTRRAIVTAVPGTTRDTIEYPVTWNETRFSMVDTGGLFGASEDPLHALVVEQGNRTLGQADLVLVVFDGEAGLVPGDLDVVQSVRALGKPMVAVVNKTDVRVAREAAVQFFELGLNPIVEISAEHGSGVDDLLDEVVRRLPPSRGARKAQPRDASAEGERAEDIAASPELKEIGIAIVGRPNAGKSSLVNRLLREERMVVSDVPGTTRDAVDVVLRWHRRTFRIVDTAGIRRPGRVSRSGALESLSVMVARRAIERADVVVLLIDATVGATDQDAAIAGEADKAGCGVIIAANKWDLMKDRGPDFSKGFDETVRRQLKFLDWAPVMHISAASGERTPRLLEMIDRVAESRRKRVGTGELNRFVAEVTAEHPPASPGRREVRIMYAAQTAVAPPTFVFFTNVATNFHFSYERFLQNRLRDAFGFLGTPIRIHVRRRAGRTKKA
ncbi:MAG TPA: ribosome biogenesis GTPase Der [Vicinamibacterales bacterium]|nr:ribosome biogenesis GTPase Der [Vicinamibacterales bacterium]